MAFENFGQYSEVTSDQNAKNTGYSNWLYEGSYFCTTLGGSWTTVAGADFLSTGGVSMTTVALLSLEMIGGASIEVLGGSSVKVMKGFFDYDFSSCSTQVKVSKGDILEYNASNTTNFTLTGDNWVRQTEKTFAQEADAWLGTKSLVAQSDIQKIVDGNLSYVSLTTNVVQAVSQMIGGSNSATASIHNLNSSQGGQVSVGALVRINAPTVKITGTLVNIG
jgi:hypothetical protein